MKPIQENYANLISLWNIYGAEKLINANVSIKYNLNWPYRSWLHHTSATKKPIDLKEALKELKNKPGKRTFSIFKHDNLAKELINNEFRTALTESGFHHTVNQLAMYLDLSEWHQDITNNDFKIIKVINNSQVEQWCSIGSQAFDYDIEKAVIRNIRYQKNITCLLLEVNGEPVATALLYQSGKTMGVHQIAVKPDAQGKGIARTLMSELLSHCKENQLESIALQSSDAGQHLYTSLGFKELFEIQNYSEV